jgi:hypothetical protein
MRHRVYITEEAYSLLISQKESGLSLNKLTSKAVLKYYGNIDMVDYQKAALDFVRKIGSEKKALRALSSYFPVETKFYREIQNRIIEML